MRKYQGTFIDAGEVIDFANHQANLIFEAMKRTSVAEQNRISHLQGQLCMLDKLIDTLGCVRGEAGNWGID